MTDPNHAVTGGLGGPTGRHRAGCRREGESSTRPNSLGRRAFLAAGSVGTVATIAGCLASDDDSTGNGGGDDESERDESDDDGRRELSSPEIDDTDDDEDDGWEPEEVEHELPFEDDLSTVKDLHPASNRGRFRYDDRDESQFPRPPEADEETDRIRLSRARATDEHVVYKFTEEIGSVRAEVHYHVEERGEIAIALSPDGEEWTDVDAERRVYNEAHENEDEIGYWWENVEYTAEFVDAGMYYLRITLAGETRWSPQLGRVEVEGQPDEVVHDLPIEDSLSNLSRVHDLSDDHLLVFDTTNEIQFARPPEAETKTDPSRLNRRSGEDAHVVYKFVDEIDSIRVEAHYHPDEAGELTIAVSPDGETWTDVNVTENRYNEAHDDEAPGRWWENVEYTADDVDAGLYYLRITLAGETDWTPQLGWVEVR